VIGSGLGAVPLEGVERELEGRQVERLLVGVGVVLDGAGRVLVVVRLGVVARVGLIVRVGVVVRVGV
jgi:hypothetical protein